MVVFKPRTNYKIPMEEIMSAETTIDSKTEDENNESKWADAPELVELTPEREKELANAAREAVASTKFDDTNHADGEKKDQQMVVSKTSPAATKTAGFV